MVGILQQGQVFRLGNATEEKALWAYRYRVGGRGSRRVQRVVSLPSATRSRRSSGRWSGFAVNEAAGSALTHGELVDEFLAQHDGEPETVKNALVTDESN